MEVTLSPGARSEVGTLAAELSTAGSGLIDDPGWLAAARTASGRLPFELRDVLREFLHDPGQNGSLLLHGLPLDDASLPPTPTIPESVEVKASPSAAVSALVSLQFGELVSYRNEKGGALVQNVVPVPGQEEFQGNAGSTTLEMHTENAFHAHRPDLVLLFCLRGDPTNEAALTLASIRRAAPLLSAATREALHRPWYLTDPPPSFGGIGGGAKQPVLSGDPDDPDVLIDFHATHPDNDAARDAMAELATAFSSVIQTIKLAPGDLAVVDNRLAVHGRTAFTPRYDGRDRWLHRTFVHLDYRRSRGSRTGGGSVLD